MKCNTIQLLSLCSWISAVATEFALIYSSTATSPLCCRCWFSTITTEFALIYSSTFTSPRIRWCWLWTSTVTTEFALIYSSTTTSPSIRSSRICLRLRLLILLLHCLYTLSHHIEAAHHISAPLPTAMWATALWRRRRSARPSKSAAAAPSSRNKHFGKREGICK